MEALVAILARRNVPYAFQSLIPTFAMQHHAFH